MNPSFEMMRAKAVRLLADKGDPGWKAVPAVYRFIWSRGVRLRPPHFASYGTNFLVYGGSAGGFTTISVGLAIVATGGEMPLLRSLVMGLCTAVIFGWSAAARHKREAEYHGLPPWDQLAAAADFD